MRLEKLIFVAVLAIFMVAPLLQMVVPFVKMPPVEEFRTLAVAPDLIGKITHGDGRIAAGVNAWFDDHVGFRPILTRIANQIDYSIFSYSKKVLIGKNSWLFEPGILNGAIINARAGDSALVALFEKMLQLADFLKRRNIRLVVISTPARETVYSDLLPLGAPRGPVPTPFQRFRTFLQESDGRDWIHIDSQALVTRQPQKVDLYLRTDPHMTLFGNFLVAKEMVNRMAEAEGVEWRWNDDINLRNLRREEWSGGAYVRFLSLFTKLSETVSDLNPGFNLNAPPPGEYFETPPAKPFETIYHNETGRPTLPRTVMFGSSFVDWYVALGAYSNFKDLYRTRGTADLMGDTLNAIPEGTRYFIFQFWEPHYSAFAGAKIPVD